MIHHHCHLNKEFMEEERFGKNPEYTIPLETHDMVHTADVLKKPTTPLREV